MSYVCPYNNQRAYWSRVERWGWLWPPDNVVRVRASRVEARSLLAIDIHHEPDLIVIAVIFRFLRYARDELGGWVIPCSSDRIRIRIAISASNFDAMCVFGLQAHFVLPLG